MDILLVGGAGVGKDTVGDILKRHGYISIAIADILKTMVYRVWSANDAEAKITAIYCGVLGCSPGEDYPRLKRIAQGIKGVDAFEKTQIRPYLQELGDIFRNKEPDVFSRILLEKVEEVRGMEKTPPVVITDGRLEREVNYFKERGFFTVKIVCDYDLRVERLIKRDGSFDTAVLLHITEKDIEGINCDHILANNGTIADLEKEIASWQLPVLS